MPISRGYACVDYWTITTPRTSVLRSIPSLNMYSMFTLWILKLHLRRDNVGTGSKVSKTTWTMMEAFD